MHHFPKTLSQGIRAELNGQSLDSRQRWGEHEIQGHSPIRISLVQKPLRMCADILGHEILF